jgi:uncharacterized protein YndB with AHSA1/START domain
VRGMTARVIEMTNSSTDRIERSIVIDAPRARVWRALTDAEEFGTWFGANLEGPAFAPGKRTRGPITFKGYEHMSFDIVVERIEPQDLLSYRWHPYPMDPKVDYDKEEPTLVTFTLKDAPGNATLLTVVESGFDRVPPERRMEAFRMNTRGWEAQLKSVARHVIA